MRIIVACEFSGKVSAAFRARGHYAISCDLRATIGDSAHHKQIDVRALLSAEWDMMIAFPPCTDLAASGARHFARKRADGRQQRAAEFFTTLAGADHIPMIAIENPIGVMSTLYRKPDQIIHPWQFGHGQTKATCLWLKGLPQLRPTNIVSGREVNTWYAKREDRALNRSITFDGIAKAMAEQWG